MLGAGVVLAVAIAGAAFVLAVRDDDAPPGESAAEAPPTPAQSPTFEPPTPGDNAAAALAGGGRELLYVEDGELIRRDLSDDDEEELGFIPFSQVEAAPGSLEIAYTVFESPTGEGEPFLYLYDEENEEEVQIARGFSPLWNATGTELAYLRQLDSTSCTEMRCGGESRVMVLDPETQTSERLLGRGSWEITAWAGDYLVVGDRAKRNKAFTVSPFGDRRAIDVPARDIVTGSPDGEWFLVASEDEGESSFVPLSAGRIAGDPIPIPLDGDVIDGKWSHDSSRVAAAVSGPGGTSELVLLWPESPEPKPVPESLGATGRLLWSPDNDAVAFARLNEEETQLEAFHCGLEIGADCELLLEWSTGVIILRLE